MFNKALLFLFIHIIYNIDSLYASSSLLTQEDTLKYNIYKLRQLDEPFILHVALEGPNAIVGGLGTVIRDLGNKLKENYKNCFTAIPYYKFLQEVLPSKVKVTSLGFLESSLFDRTIITEIFFNKTDNQFLFLPDSTIEDCCNIVTSTNSIYEPTHNLLRIKFFNSAIAKFSHIADIDIVQLHAWQTALSAALIREKYNLYRFKNELEKIKIVSTFHLLSEDQGIYKESIYSHVGLKEPEDGIVNLAATAILNSDYITTVSQGLVNCFMDPEKSFGLDQLFTKKKNVIRGITNGIDYSKFNPFSEKILGNLRLNENFTLEELKFSKDRAKNILWKNNLIASETKPLIYSVGRFSTEKGTGSFETAIEKWLSMGGQAVIMGIFTQDQSATNQILSLRERQKKDSLFANNLRIYTDLQKDQLDFISDACQIQKGTLIRFASDLFYIPSQVESCGLVALESLSFGTPIFTSWVQGLIDMCFPYKAYHPLLQKKINKTDFNAVSFNYFPKDEKSTFISIRNNIEFAYDIITGKKFDSEILLTAQKRMIDNAKYFDWQAPGGAIQEYCKLYKDLIGDSYQRPRLKVSPETKDKEHLMQTLIFKFGKYPPSKVVFKYEKFHPFLLTTLVQSKREPETPYNSSNLKNLTGVTIHNKKLYINNIEFDTETLKKQNGSFHNTWVLDKKGELFAGAFCHAYILKSKPGSPYYGFSKALAGAGDIIVKSGIITYIDNRSGHFMINEDQFFLDLHYFYSLGLINKECIIKEEKTGKQIFLKDIQNLDVLKILSKYPTLNKLSI